MCFAKEPAVSGTDQSSLTLWRAIQASFFLESLWSTKLCPEAEPKLIVFVLPSADLSTAFNLLPFDDDGKKATLIYFIYTTC